MSNKKIIVDGDYYYIDIANTNRNGHIRCVMCGDVARYVASNTKEALCEQCTYNNEEARTKR